MEYQTQTLPPETLTKFSQTSSDTAEFRVLAADGHSIVKLPIDPDMPAADSRQLMSSLAMMIAQSRGQSEVPIENLLMLREAFRRNNVTCAEAADAFWLAYGDSYLPATGIDFRHLWKHIDMGRKGTGNRYFTYDEVLKKMHDDNLPQKCFAITDVRDAGGKRLWVLK